MRDLQLLVLAGLLSCTTAFMSIEPSQCSTSTTPTQLYGGGSAYSTSLDGKKETVEKVKGLLGNSDLIFTVPASSISVAQQQKLRRSLPEGTTCKVIKNKLMIRALEDSEFQIVGDKLLTGANMWFFVEDDISASIKAYNEFVKETGKRETHEIIGGCMESTFYDGSGIQDIGKLPTKLELYAMIARSINAVPTKLAKSIKEAGGNKLARAIKLATDPEKKDE